MVSASSSWDAHGDFKDAVLPPLPKVNAFLICDHVIHEAGTNKKTLVGIFHNINAHAFPCTHHSMCIYANLIDAMGPYDFEIRLIELSSGAKVGNASLPTIKINDRLRPAEICINLQGITFTRPGKYEFQLYGNKEIIASKDFLVDKMERRESRSDPPSAPGPTAPESY